jgi:16S rRNA (cytosine1402-N4)-methyltransferase
MGFGGHAVKFIQRIGETGKYVGMDIDGEHIERTSRKLSALKVETAFHRINFSEIADVAAQSAPDGFDIIFADLGISSMQVDDASRGISYKSDGPLDMRMDDRLEKTGADLLVELTEEQLSEILWKYSDEPDHKLIAQWIAGQRLSNPITTVNQLVRLVINAKGLTEKTWKKKNKSMPFGSAHPAARTFQAIRIAVNGEIDSLEKLLSDAPNCLKPGGMIGIMSFQSGEDKLVKHAFKAGLEDGTYHEISKKAITPAKWEIMKNSRSSSARFRWAKRSK